MKLDRRRVLTGLAGVVALKQAPAVQAQTRVVIGQSAPLSGSNAAFGRAIVAGARAWFTRYNRNARLPIEHVVLDDGNEASRSGANATALLERGASAMFGFASATLSLPALPALKAAGVPLYAPFTGASVIHGTHDPLIFTARASYAVEAARFVELLRGYGVTKIGVVHFGDRVGNENRDVVVGEIERAQLKAIAFSTERNKPVTPELVQKIVAEHPQAIVFTTTAAPTAEILLGAQKLGLSRSVFRVTLSFVGPSQVQELLGNAASGLVVSYVVPRPWGSEPIAIEHVGAMRALGPEPATFASLESYMAARALTAAIERAGSGRASSIVTGLEGLDLDLGGYRLRYSRSNHNGSNYANYMILGVDFVRGS